LLLVRTAGALADPSGHPARSRSTQCRQQRGRLGVSAGAAQARGKPPAFGVAPAICREIGRTSSLYISPLLEQEAEVGRGFGVSERKASSPCPFGSIEISGLVQQDAEIESGVGFPMFFCSRIGRGGSFQIASLVQFERQLE
jgi:hypothetical protein